MYTRSSQYLLRVYLKVYKSFSNDLLIKSSEKRPVSVPAASPSSDHLSLTMRKLRHLRTSACGLVARITPGWKHIFVANGPQPLPFRVRPRLSSASSSAGECSKDCEDVSCNVEICSVYDIRWKSPSVITRVKSKVINYYLLVTELLTVSSLHVANTTLQHVDSIRHPPPEHGLAPCRYSYGSAEESTQTEKIQVMKLRFL